MDFRIIIENAWKGEWKNQIGNGKTKEKGKD